MIAELLDVTEDDLRKSRREARSLLIWIGQALNWMDTIPVVFESGESEIKFAIRQIARPGVNKRGTLTEKRVRSLCGYANYFFRFQNKERWTVRLQSEMLGRYWVFIFTITTRALDLERFPTEERLVRLCGDRAHTALRERLDLLVDPDFDAHQESPHTTHLLNHPQGEQVLESS